MNKRIIGFGILGVVAVAVLLSTTMTSCLNPELKELNPCLVSGVVDQVNIDKVDSVDLMFIIDKSQSMIQEQTKIRDQFGRLISVLTSGDKDPKDGITEGINFMPAKSLHLAVVSSDLGLPVITAAGELPDASCKGFGDDGVFQNQPHSKIEGQTDPTVADLKCKGSYPSFLDYTAKGGDVAAITLDFQCIAGIGPYGCGFEQQLEAGLKALWPANPSAKVLEAYREFSGSDKPISFLAGQGHGDSAGHADFLRGTDYYLRNHPDQQGKYSLLAVVAVSDENDCSMGANGNMDILKKAPAGLTDEQKKNLNLRCYYDSLLPNPNRYPVERYAAGFKALRGRGKEYLTIFGAIVGVPTNLIRAEADLDIDKDTVISPEERDAYFHSILSDPSMQEQEDPNAKGYLQSACLLEKPAGEYDPTAPDGSAKAEKYVTDAQPGRRFVEVAHQFGVNGVVRSICEENFTGAIDQIIDAVSKQLGGVCLKRQLNRDADGLVSCDITWDMPSTETNCDHPDFAAYLQFPKPGERSRTDDGRPVCTVKQIPVVAPTQGIGAETGAFLKALKLDATGGVGWYYDDFSNTIAKDCKVQKQRIAFVLSTGAQPVQDPPAGVTVNLVCLKEMNALLTGGGSSGKKIGDQCDSEKDPCTQTGHICHPQSKVCVQTCNSTSQCPPAWVCDKRKGTIEGGTLNGVAVVGTGAPICVNPTCGS